MRILWVKSGGLLPLDAGGKIRSYNIARELARRHDVDLFTFYPKIEDDPHEQLRGLFRRVESWPLAMFERASVGDAFAYGANMLTMQPYQLRKYCRPEIRRRLRQLIRENDYDLILCDFLLTAGVMPWDLDVPIVIFTHNVEAMIWSRHCETAQNPVWKFITWREYRTMARAERRFTGLADHVLTVSEQDRAEFCAFLSGDKVTAIPTGVDLEYFREAPLPKSSNSMVFTGSMDWLPNEDAIIYFASKILPIIQTRLPDVKLSVVGRKPTRKVMALAETNPALRIVGRVDDIRPYVHEAAAYVVPLRIGGGTRIKIFEAMAMGAAVVSTNIGAEGLPVKHNDNILLADSPEDFAACTVSVLSQPAERDRIGRAARNLVEARFGWSNVVDVFENALLKVGPRNQNAHAPQIQRNTAPERSPVEESLRG
jgi:polysaccharide biosynthesis protein PslH